MESQTVTAVLDASKDEVFTFLAEIENLPRWATEFARELKHEDGKTKVVNGTGEFFVEIDADAESGVIDIYAGPTADALSLFPTRVVELPGARSAYTFTMFQAPRMPDDLFASQHEALLREFENIRREFS